MLVKYAFATSAHARELRHVSEGVLICRFARLLQCCLKSALFVCGPNCCASPILVVGMSWRDLASPPSPRDRVTSHTLRIRLHLFRKVDWHLSSSRDSSYSDDPS